jgi:hypothetical protein
VRQFSFNVSILGTLSFLRLHHFNLQFVELFNGLFVRLPIVLILEQFVEPLFILVEGNISFLAKYMQRQNIDLSALSANILFGQRIRRQS